MSHLARTLSATVVVALSMLSPSRGGEIRVPGDFATIQAAIGHAKPGDTVLVDPGRYREQLTISAKVVVRSPGDATPGKIGLLRAESTIIDAGGKAFGIVLEQGAALDGFTVTGVGRFDQAVFDKHHAERGENLADDHGAVGVKGGGAAISITGVEARVSHCIVHDNGHPGIGVSGDSARALIENNSVYRNMGGGIGFANGARGVVSGNRCWKNLRAGIGCRAASPTIWGNHCYENVRAGIGIREGSCPAVHDNECYENQRAGIGIRMAGTEPRIYSNKCYDNGMAGIGCRDSAAPVIFENESYRNRLAGIGAMSDARPSIVGNHLYENDAAAIGLDACESGEALIRDNRIVAKTLVCIGIKTGWTARVEDNEITRKGGMPPLVMVFGGARADFLGNEFTGSGVAAIRSQGQIFVCDNEFNCPAPREGGPPQDAVWALEGSALAMTDDNQINGWRKPANPAIRVKNRKELDTALERAAPGSTILLAPGEYRGGINRRNLQGAAGRPIVIAGADRKNPPVIKGGASGIQLSDPQYVELRNLVIDAATANGINFDDGGTFDSRAQHVVLSDLVVRDIDGRGNRDGIKFSGVRNFRIEHCRIERWGDGGSGIDMVGCHHGLVYGCEFEHAEKAVSANGVQIKGGSQKIAVRRCSFKNAGGRAINLGGSTGADYFRPRDAKSEASELLVEDCLIEGSMAPIAFVGVDGAMVRNNTIFRPRRWIARILQENTQPHLARCRNGRFERNLVAFRSDELRTSINIGTSTEKDTFGFVGNEWLCYDGKYASEILYPFPVPESDGTYSRMPKPVELDVAELKTLFTEPDIGVRWWSAAE